MIVQANKRSTLYMTTDLVMWLLLLKIILMQSNSIIDLGHESKRDERTIVKWEAPRAKDC